jgi:hypothetical protein
MIRLINFHNKEQVMQDSLYIKLLLIKTEKNNIQLTQNNRSSEQ